MTPRLLLVEKYGYKSRQGQVDLWEVLTPDMRDREFSGSFEECEKYLRNQCPNGSCEE